MSERILGRYTAELDEQGTLTLYGPGARMALPYDEAYTLLTWLDKNHRDTLFWLVQEDQESELYLKNIGLVGDITLQDDDFGL